MKYRIAYGRRHLCLTVPGERVAGILAPRATRELTDVDAAVRRALTKPTRSPALTDVLREKRSALIATVDNTRPSPRTLLLPVVALCRRHGIRPTIIIATGRHRQMTTAEVRDHLGKDIGSQCDVLQHDPFDDSQMVSRGRTKRGTPIRVNKAVFEHEVVIGCGVIEPSYLSGWSGGRKILMPGLAHHESIDNNHFYLTHPDAIIGRLRGNPVGDDAAEFASHLPLHFIVYAAIGPNDEMVRIFAGHPVAAHEEACRYSRRIYVVRKRRADIVISSPGGAPHDCDLVQGKKAIIPATDAVKRNGVIIICAECPDGLGAEETFVDWLRNKTPMEVVRDVLDRKQFSLGAHGANILARPIVDHNARVILVTNPDTARTLRGTYVTALSRISDAWRLADLLTGASSRVLFIERARRLIMT